MSDPTELSQIDGQIAEARARVLASAAEAREVLREDLVAFVDREARARFVMAPAFADSLTDAQIAEIKADIVESGGAAAGAILDRIAADEPWLAGLQHLTDDSRTFEDNPALWDIVGEIAVAAVGVLERHGFARPEGGFEVAYAQPKRFIGGRHMGTISEAYWRAVREMAVWGEERERLEQVARSGELRARWDSA